MAYLDNEEVIAAFETQYQHYAICWIQEASKWQVEVNSWQVVEGLFHYGLFQIITSEPPRMSHFQHYPAKRIIFSGHGLAGALDHMFLICYMINNRGEDKEHISIGFGSPYFCDNAAKRFCQKTMKLDRRMFTFVNATCGFKDDLQSRVSRKEGRLLLLGKIEYMVGLKKFG